MNRGNLPHLLALLTSKATASVHQPSQDSAIDQVKDERRYGYSGSDRDPEKAPAKQREDNDLHDEP